MSPKETQPEVADQNTESATPATATKKRQRKAKPTHKMGPKETQPEVADQNTESATPATATKKRQRKAKPTHKMGPKETQPEVADQNTESATPAPATATEKKQRKAKPANPFKKEEKEKRRQKRARIIIRNISYKATDAKLREHFEKFGKILDLNLLKRADGKLVGCAFIQYEATNHAAKAILKATNQEFLGRPVYVDWAVGKDEFGKKADGAGVKEMKEECDESEIKEEEDGSDDEEQDIKSEDEDDDDKSIKSEDDSEGEDDDDYDDDEEDKKDIKKFKHDPEDVKPKNVSNDVQEGCTVFIKNVPFDAEDNDLRKVCRKFGPIYYSIINRDFVSGHSKGTAFVKFKTKESADICLRSGEEFVLMDTVLEPFPAMSRDEVRNHSDKNSKDENKDSRNLYLAKEGLIMTGSKSSEGVSASDMRKRHNLERVKTQVLKNLNRFVSRNRLSIHNLPVTYDNEKLREMLVQHTQLRPHECRVMRENKVSAEYPQGMSKGFGFMSFSTHLDALNALRKLNNNPNVFGNVNRPIVAFSLEDRAVHKVKENRLERSRANNPNYQDKLQKRKEQRKEIKKNKSTPAPKDNKTEVQKQIKQLEASRNAKPKPKAVDTNTDDFVGEAGKPGSFIKMRSMKKIRAQAQEHKQKVGELKRKQKQRKEKIEMRKEKRQVDRTKQRKKKPEVDNFSHLVSKYKRMIDPHTDAPKTKRKKWYTE